MKDIFPSTFSTFVQPIKHPQTSREFKAAYRKYKTLKASEILLKKDIIHFSPVVGCNEQLKKLFLKAGKDSYFPRYCHPRDLIWNDVSSCLKRKSIFTINNSNNRICFRYGNTYLTNRYFTFGLRYVNKGTNHIYQTTNVPMFIYILPSPSTTNIELKKAQKGKAIFNTKDQYLYSLYILEPNRIYKIPDLTHYLIVTTQNTLFSVDIVKSVTLLPFSLCRNPQDSKNYNNKKENNKYVDSTQQLTPLNHAQSADDEPVCLSPDSSADNNIHQTTFKMHGISSHTKEPDISSSSFSADHIESFQHNAERVEINEDIRGVVSTISSEAGPEAYRLLEDRGDEIVCLSPDSSTENNIQQTSSKIHRISSHIKEPYKSPSSSSADHTDSFQHNSERVGINEDITGVVSTISSEAGAEAYRLLENRGENTTRLAPPEYIQWFENLKEQIFFGDPTDYFFPIAEEGAMPLDLSPEVNDTDFGLDFEIDFNEELLALSHDEVFEFFKNV